MPVRRQSSSTGSTLAAALALLLALVVGCATPPKPADATELSPRLTGLASTVDAAEAELMAVTACDYSWQLAEAYGVVRPALLHNCLVNFGLRQRGLCYDWANDLEIRLQALQLRTLELHHAIARQGTWREHNALVVTAIGQKFERGVVLDAWRHSGRLYWTAVKADKYPWRELPDDEPGEVPSETLDHKTP